MGFECPNYSEGICIRQDSGCTPTRGNCILKGRYRIFIPEEELEKHPHESAGNSEKPADLNSANATD